MTRFIAAAKKFVRGEEGATMVEYGLMIALIAAVSVAVVKTIGTGLNASFTSVNGSL
jgi:pilus assembly protein Flp/PilA